MKIAKNGVPARLQWSDPYRYPTISGHNLFAIKVITLELLGTGITIFVQQAKLASVRHPDLGRHKAEVGNGDGDEKRLNSVRRRKRSEALSAGKEWGSSCRSTW